MVPCPYPMGSIKGVRWMEGGPGSLGNSFQEPGSHVFPGIFPPLATMLRIRNPPGATFGSMETKYVYTRICSAYNVHGSIAPTPWVL